MTLPAVRSLRTKLILVLVPLVVLGVGAMTFLAATRASDAQRASAQRELRELAASQANAFDAQARDAASTARTLAALGAVVPVREQLSTGLRRTLEANPRLAGMAVGFEPNAIDGQDAAHAGEPTAMEGGRFGPYWNRLAGPVAVEPLVDADTSEWYLAPKRTGRDAVVEPYLYNGKLMTTYVSPIRRDGRFVGVGTVDVVLDQLQREMRRVRVLDSGYAMAVSKAGVVVAGPDARSIGKTTLAQLARRSPGLADVAKAIAVGRPGVATGPDPKTGEDTTVAWAPVPTGTWGVLVVAPTSEVLAQAHALRNTVLVAGLVVIVLFTIALVLLAGRLTRPLAGFVTRLRSLVERDVAELRGGMQAIAGGDLTVAVASTTEPAGEAGADEIGQASRTLDELIESTRTSVDAYEATRRELGRMIGGVSDGAGRVSRASAEMAATSEETGRAVGEIAHAVTDVATGAERQVRMVASARAVAERAGARVQESATTAQETVAAADDARRLAAGGVDAAARVSEAMEAVRDASASARTAIGGLAGKSAEIGGIVQTITGIAEQTNLLALNAAIEAARAGDQGRGFAVVADEVRKLAEESQAAARTIGALIVEIQAETERAVDVVTVGAERTAAGAVTVEEARAAFESIGSSIGAVSTQIGHIAELAADVAQGTQQVEEEVAGIAAVAEQSSASTEEVSASTEQTSAAVQEVAASAQELARTAEELDRLVGQFRVTA